MNGGAGNPINPNGVKTAYLWKEILEKRSLSDIIENYAQVVKKKDEKRISMRQYGMAAESGTDEIPRKGGHKDYL